MKIKQTEIAYCTYFDKNYLVKGLAMVSSLIKHSPKTVLFVLCMDSYSEKIIKAMKFKNVKIIKLKDFEDKELLKIKPTRKFFEYYWTCTPSLPLYIFKKFKQFKYVTYLDADLFFYSSPDVAFKELDDNSIFTVEHRYPKGQEGRITTSGRFNVAFQIFKRDEEGIACLKRWRNQCNEWCYYRYEDGKMGDQVYLNEWPNRYQNLVITKNLGIDVAPWNIKQYRVAKDEKDVYINNDKLVCYHYHQFQILGENSFDYCTGYFLPGPVANFIYEPYVKELKSIIAKIKSIDKNFKIVPPERTFYQETKNDLIKRFGPFFWKLQTHFVKKWKPTVIGINTLFLVPNQVGGTEYHLRSFISYLQEFDQENSYVIFCNKENYDTFEIKNPHWRKILCPVFASNRFARIGYEQFIFPFLVESQNVTLLHSYGYFGPLNCPCKQILTIHDANWKDHPENVSKFELFASQFLIENNMKTSSKIIVDSDFSKSRLAHYFPQYEENIAVVKAGVEDKIKMLAKNKIEHPLKGQKYILCVAAMYPHKKIPYLLDVFSEMLKIDRDIKLVLIGNNGRDLKNVIERIEQMPNVFYFKKVPLKKLVAFYKYAKAFVLPSIYEGFGFPVYEAIYMGVPTFVGDINMYDSSIKSILKPLSWNPKKDAKKILTCKRESKRAKVLDYTDGTRKLMNIYETT
jgi:glycosyltransferase involved in cell wall biosynthesis